MIEQKHLDCNKEWNLSSGQLQIWLGQQLNIEVPLYNAVYLFEISGNLNPINFQSAFKELVQRTEILRAQFKKDADGIPKQYIRGFQDYHMEYIDISEKEVQNQFLEEWVDERKKVVLDIEENLLDSVLLKKNDQSYVWYINLHHLLTDGSSTKVIFEHQFNIYEAIQSNGLDELPLPPSYQSFLEFEAKNKQNEKLAPIRKYWSEKTKGIKPISTLYGNKAISKSSASKRLTVSLGLERSNQIREWAKTSQPMSWSQDISLFNLFLTTFFVFSNRISGETNLLVGAPSHNRSTQRFKNTLGLFIEFFPLLMKIEKMDTFSNLLKRVQEESFNYLKNAVAGSTSEEVNRDVRLIFNYINAKLPKIEGFDVKSEWIHPGHHDPTHFIRCNIMDMDGTGEFQLLMDVNEAMFAEQEMEAIPRQYINLVDAFMADMSQSIYQPSLQSPTELELLKSGAHKLWDDYNEIIPQIQTHLNKGQDIALVSNGKELTYAELNEKANILANFLKKSGVSKGDIIGVHLTRSPEYIITLLAILKLGAVFMPISSDQPKERIKFMLNDSNCGLVITEANLKDNLLEQITRVEVEKVFEAGNGIPLENEPCNPEDLAYILYTSGSTGTPKGVCISHGAFANYLNWASQYYNEGNEKYNFPLFTSIGFDLTITSTFLPLLTGGEIHIFKESNSGPDFSLFDVIKDNRVNTIKLTPSHLAMLESTDLSGWGVKTLIVGGEDFKTSLAQTVTNSVEGQINIYNEFGPTESTVGCIVAKFNPEQHTGISVPIGQPIRNTFALVLDEGMNPVPDGIVGTLFLGGDGVAEGYLNQDGLTKERFVKTPFGRNQKMYDTGDLVRINRDKVFEYMGRVDEQVKINGYRIELNEIEYVYTAMEGIANVVVVPINSQDVCNLSEGNLQVESTLIAYFTGNKDVDTEALTRKANLRLPSYMIPNRLVHLEEFPLTSNGKVDRKKIQEMTLEQILEKSLSSDLGQKTSYIAPRNDIEEVLVDTWSKVLELESIGVFDNFIQLGGYSLAAIRITSRLNEDLSLNLPFNKIFEFPTVADYAKYIEETIVALMNEQ